MVDLMQDNTKYLLADSGYIGKEKEIQLAEKGIKLHAVRKRKKGQKELSVEDKQYNQQVSKVRCRVEHVFGTIKQIPYSAQKMHEICEFSKPRLQYETLCFSMPSGTTVP